MKSGDGLTGARACFLRRRTKKQHTNNMAPAPRIEIGIPTPNPIFAFRDMPECCSSGAGGTDVFGDSVGFTFPLTMVPAEIVTTEVTNLVVGSRLVARLLAFEAFEEPNVAVSLEEPDNGIFVFVSVENLVVTGTLVSLALDTGGVAEENTGIEGVGTADAVCGPNCRTK